MPERETKHNSNAWLDALLGVPKIYLPCKKCPRQVGPYYSTREALISLAEHYCKPYQLFLTKRRSSRPRGAKNGRG